MDSELLEVIDQTMMDKISRKMTILFKLMIGLMLCLRVLMAFDVIHMDEDLAFRFKIMPFVGAIFYILSNRIQRQDINPRYRTLAYPLYLVISTEFNLRQESLSQMMAFAYTQ